MSLQYDIYIYINYSLFTSRINTYFCRKKCFESACELVNNIYIRGIRTYLRQKFNKKVIKIFELHHVIMHNILFQNVLIPPIHILFMPTIYYNCENSLYFMKNSLSKSCTKLINFTNKAYETYSLLVKYKKFWLINFISWIFKRKISWCSQSVFY